VSKQRVRIWQAVASFLVMIGGLWLLGYHLVTSETWLEVLRHNWGVTAMVIVYSVMLLALIRLEKRAR
jgi:hypothetical protein